MNRVRRIALSALFLVAGVSVAADVRVHLNASPDAARCIAGARVFARSNAAEVVGTITDGATTTLTLPGGGSWTVRAVSEGCWSETAEMSPLEGDVHLRLYASAHLRGSFLKPAGPSLHELKGAVFATPQTSERALPARESGHPIDCQLDAIDWDCEVPSGVPFDLRLDAPHFAPLFFWNVVARAGEARTLEPRALQKGSSMSGWVAGPDGKAIRDARLALLPAMHAVGEQTRVGTRELTARTNERGFFQFAGVPPGEYRLVSRAENLSPIAIPIVRIGEDESLVWPRVITHLAPASVELQLDPATDDGRPWIVALEEHVPLTASPAAPLRRAANADGSWRAENLRADLYRASVADTDGSVLERFEADLSRSGTTRIPVSVRRINVRGVLRFGDEPLQADVRFSNQSGRSVSAKANGLGQFDARFPSTGKWTPIVYPDGPNGPRIRARSIMIPDAEADRDTIEIVLSGGRIRGKVLDQRGRAVKAAVHVVRDGTLSAQQITDDDGAFSFIGIDKGDYAVSAEGDAGASPERRTTVADGETVDLKLELRALSELRGVVLTPSAAPASGAVVRISTDGCRSWSDVIADVEGRFEYSAAETGAPITVVVLTFSYPALFAQLPSSAREPVTLRLQDRGGKLRVTRRAFVGKGSALAPLSMFFFPGSPLGLYDGAAYLEPGPYTVCGGQTAEARCQQVTINPAIDVTIDPEAAR